MSLRGKAVVLSALAAFALIAIAGCGGGGGGNGAPVINSLTAAPPALWPGQLSAIAANATDPSGNPLSYAWAVTPATATLRGSGATRTFTTQTGGVYTVTVTVSDGLGGQASKQVSVTVGATARGTTIDVADGAIEAGVPVTINGRSATSDAQGVFVVRGIGQGQHTLSVGGDYALIGASVIVNATTPGQTIQLGNINVADIGGGPPPPPFAP